MLGIHREGVDKKLNIIKIEHVGSQALSKLSSIYGKIDMSSRDDADQANPKGEEKYQFRIKKSLMVKKMQLGFLRRQVFFPYMISN